MNFSGLEETGLKRSVSISKILERARIRLLWGARRRRRGGRGSGANAEETQSFNGQTWNIAGLRPGRPGGPGRTLATARRDQFPLSFEPKGFGEEFFLDSHA